MYASELLLKKPLIPPFFFVLKIKYEKEKKTQFSSAEKSAFSAKLIKGFHVLNIATMKLKFGQIFFGD